MNIAVIGASAGIGLETVSLGLKNGHHIIALSRDTNKIPAHPMLTKVNASATSVPDLVEVMSSSDAVLITVGTKKKKGTSLFSEIAKSIIAASKAVEYRKPIIIVTGFGAGDSRPYLGFFMKSVIKLFMKDQYVDKTLMEDFITGSNINWEIVRPGILTNGDATGSLKVLSTLEHGMKVGKISRKDVAEYLIAEVENPMHIGQKITVT